MPIEIDHKDDGVIIWEWGVITDQEFLHAAAEIYHHEGVENYRYQLAEMSRVTDFQVSPQIMRRVAEIDMEAVKNYPQHAIVVASSDLVYGMNQIWRNVSEGESFITNVVRTLDEALKWLKQKGIDVEL